MKIITVIQYTDGKEIAEGLRASQKERPGLLRMSPAAQEVTPLGRRCMGKERTLLSVRAAS